MDTKYPFDSSIRESQLNHDQRRNSKSTENIYARNSYGLFDNHQYSASYSSLYIRESQRNSKSTANISAKNPFDFFDNNLYPSLKDFNYDPWRNSKPNDESNLKDASLIDLISFTDTLLLSPTPSTSSNSSSDDSRLCFPISDPFVGVTLKNYLIVKPLGKGAFGQVYHVDDQNLDKE